MRKISFLFILCFSLSAACFAQGGKALAEADRYFGIRNYQEALPKFLEAIKEGQKDPMVHYKTGVCYQKSTEITEQSKAIPFLEYALKNNAVVPVLTHFELGDLLLRNEELQKAIDRYNQFKELVKADKKAVAKADRAIEICHNAVTFMSVNRPAIVRNFGSSVNSSFTEYNPVVSADESEMAFTALRPNTGKTRSGDKFIEEILISYNKSGNWTEPVVVPVASDYNVGTAGITADGQKMLIFMGGATDPGNILAISKSGESWSNPGILANTLNSKYLESTASITPDGKTVYFASDRVGGLGGLDIYKIELQPNGTTWSAPVNLGAPINSKDNEDAPYIHPDKKTLFFTSDGHNTMGGRDIFFTKLVKDKWTTPENMGYPINTTANDNYFTLIADGTRGYFSSDRKGGMGSQDIYYMDMPEGASSIPLTMIKGRILNMETGKPMPTKIYLIDNETNKKLDFVYDPDPETGNYLIILPPAKNYDMVIESEGFLPYTLNINVPNQDYFYELYQQINLKTIKQFDVVVGQEVQVKNAFYDANQDVKADLRKTHEAKLVQSGNVDIYDMMLDLVAAGDQEGIDYVLDLIHMSNTIENINFDDTNTKLEVASRQYYYDESDESKFEKKKLDDKTILSLPTFMVTEEASKQKKQQKKMSSFDNAALAKLAKVYFDAGKSDLKAQYNTQLDGLLAELQKYADLGVEISGFASAEGTEELNRELSNKRAITVLDYFNHKGVVRRRIVAKGYGATKDQAATKEEGRRVEVRLVDLNQLSDK